jgi:hypothetical protein
MSYPIDASGDFEYPKNEETQTSNVRQVLEQPAPYTPRWPRGRVAGPGEIAYDPSRGQGKLW